MRRRQPLYPPRCAASPPSLYPFPVPRRRCTLWMLHRLADAFRGSPGTPAAHRAAICKFFFRAREVFRLFRAVLPSSSVPALWLTRRRICTPLHTKKTGLFAKLCAVSILLRISILYTQKKFRFLQKNLQKSLHVSNIITNFAHVR